MEKVKSFLVLILPFLASIYLEGMETTQFITYMASVSGIFFLTPIVVQFLKTELNTTGFVTQLVSWGTSTVLVFLSWFLGWGFAEFIWWQLFFVGIGIGLATNGYFTIEFIQTLLNILFPRKQ